MLPDRRATLIIAASYAALVALAFLAYATTHVHVGALAVIPILFIAYYVRPYAALVTAFVTGAAIGLLDHAVPPEVHAFDAPPIIDAFTLSISLCVIVVVANRLRETSTANELLRGSLLKARRAADHDPLTGLLNRTSFMRALEEAITQATDERRTAVLFCDLDGFKRINDAYGHVTGDSVLRMAASRLVNTVRAVDVVGRVGGDEFCILVRGVHDADEAAHMSANIERAFADPFHAQSDRYGVGVTAGAAICPDDGRDPQTLLRIADARMYRRKQAKHAARTAT